MEVYNIWPTYVIRQAIYIFILWFPLLFSSPNLSGWRLDICHIPHMVRPCKFRLQVWNMLRAARWKYSTQKIAINSPSGHHPTTLSGFIFATKACIDNRKKVLSNNISSICAHNMVNFGPLAAEICWRVWDTLQISTGFASWQRYCTAFQYWASAKHCAVEYRAPPIFGTAAITLGIVPHF